MSNMRGLATQAPRLGGPGAETHAAGQSRQSRPPLNFLGLSAETGDNRTRKPTTNAEANMSMTPIPSRNDRRLVFTSSQAAVYLGVSLATIRRWTDAGHLGCYRTPGGQRRFSREQLDGFIASLHRDGPDERAAGQAAAAAQGAPGQGTPGARAPVGQRVGQRPPARVA
jgi:excisionase family DNA binding protein